MTLRYKKSHLNLLAGLGISLLIISGVLYYFGAGEFVAVFLSMGLYNIVLYIFRSRKHYLAIRNGAIIKSGWFGGRIPLDDIRQISRFGGDIFIRGAQNEIPVYTAFLDPESLRRFERLILQYEEDKHAHSIDDRHVIG